MNEDFKKRIIEDLEKSGFSSELRAIRDFKEMKWDCTGFANFYDLDQERITAVDLRAWRLNELSRGELNYGLNFQIVAEVKKTERPWIVFKEHQQEISDDNINNLLYFCNIIPHRLKKVLSQNSVFTEAGWRGYNVHEFEKKPNAPSRSYSAFIKACKSAESILHSASVYYEEMKDVYKNNPSEFLDMIVIFVKPVVVINGSLLVADFNDNGELDVSEVTSASIEFYYKSKQCRKGVYLVDIVTLEGLKEYIKLSEKRQEEILDEIESLAVSKVMLNLKLNSE